jgi:hypothetical protein
MADVHFPVSGKIIYLADRRPKARGTSEPQETHGDELVILVLRKSGDATAWVSEKVQTYEEWRLVRDFLKQAELGLEHIRDEEDK